MTIQISWSDCLNFFALHHFGSAACGPSFFYSLPVMNVLRALANFQAFHAGAPGENFLLPGDSAYSTKEIGNGTDRNVGNRRGSAHLR
ncbi:MAG: hypothetical protein ACK4PN_04780 [Allorhizobium sp.]